MTWSIIARDASGAFGIAIASRFFAVGALCPHIRSGVGAVATQALVNPLYGPLALDALAAGQSVEEAIQNAVTPDEGRDLRQIHIIDSSGRSARHTGASCVEWCGHASGESFSVAGNMLAGEEVIASTAAFYADNPEMPFAERLVGALAAGEAAGGDKRGKQAAALLIHTTEDYPFLDVRVDDHVEPIAELRRLLEASYERFQPFTKYLATKANPSGTIDLRVIEEGVQQFHEDRRAAGDEK